MLERRPPAPPTPADGAQPPAVPQPAPEARPACTSNCLFCGAPMYGVHCKQICPNCGYREDCSDLFRLG